MLRRMTCDHASGFRRKDLKHDEKECDGGGERDDQAENQFLGFACADGFIDENVHRHHRKEKGAQTERDVGA